MLLAKGNILCAFPLKLCTHACTHVFQWGMQCLMQCTSSSHTEHMRVRRNPGKGRTSVHRAVGSADTMYKSRGPWETSMGHLLHMPSHTYITVGRWSDAVDANVNASDADHYLLEGCMHPYEPEHNTQMLIYSANMAGRVSWRTY